MRYRFFGTKLPDEDIIEIFMEYDAIGNELIFIDKDKIYYPYLALERKLFFEHKRCKKKVKSKGIEYEICWDDADSLKECMDPIVNGLLKSKKDYLAAQSREKEREKERARKANAAKSRARRAKERAIQIGSEGEEDYDIDDDDRAQQKNDEQLEVQQQQNSPSPMVCI